MWTSSQTRGQALPERSAADLGVVTVSSAAEAGVYLNGERRWLPVLAPGGYRWRPGVGDSVLVLKTGADGESPCILARRQESVRELAPGEVELSSQGCALRLTGQGSVELSGRVLVNGVALEELIRAEAAALLAQSSQSQEK